MAGRLAHLYPKARPRARGAFWIAKLLRPLLRLRARYFYPAVTAKDRNEAVSGLGLVVKPGVFSPKAFLTSTLLPDAIDRIHVAPGARWLELGTGCGLAALYAARGGARIVATDINPGAVACARENAARLGVQDKLDVREGDLFAPVAGERFDVILFHPPYFAGEQSAGFHQAWNFGDVPQRFARDLAKHLTEGGCAYLLLSSNGDCAAYLSALEDAGFALDIFLERELFVERALIYRVYTEKPA